LSDGTVYLHGSERLAVGLYLADESPNEVFLEKSDIMGGGKIEIVVRCRSCGRSPYGAFSAPDYVGKIKDNTFAVCSYTM
jgi:hypothetical protein